MDTAQEVDTIKEASVEDMLYPEQEQSVDGSTESDKDTEESQESVKDVETDSKESDEDKADQESTDNKEEEITYELELKEGSLLDNSTVEEIKSFAKENNLSNEQAQEILSKQDKVLSQWQEKQLSEHSQRVDEWRKEVESDPVMGGDNLERVSQQARSVVERFASEDFKTMLRDSGFGNHPELVRFLSSIGREMSNDSLVLPRAKEAANRPIEDIFYGNNN